MSFFYVLLVIVVVNFGTFNFCSINYTIHTINLVKFSIFFKAQILLGRTNGLYYNFFSKVLLI